MNAGVLEGSHVQHKFKAAALLFMYVNHNTVGDFKDTAREPLLYNSGSISGECSLR